MKKFTTFYWAISTVLSAAALIFLFIDNRDLVFMICTFIILILLTPNFFIRAYNAKRSREIEKVYVEECDPIKYVSLQEKEYKKTIKTKMSRYLYKARCADFLNESGRFSDARQLLEELTDHEEEFNSVVLSLYYKVWISYFLEFGNFERVQIILEQLQSTALNAPSRNMQMFCMGIFYSCQAKYNVLTNRDLQNTENYFASMVNMNRGNAYNVAGMYYLSIIALHKGEVDKAITRLNFVIKNGNKMYCVIKARNMLNKISV